MAQGLCLMPYALTYFIRQAIRKQHTLLQHQHHHSQRHQPETVHLVCVLSTLSQKSSYLWLMVYGLWLMAYGLWLMAYGLWLMPYALCLMPSALCLNILHKIGHNKTTYSVAEPAPQQPAAPTENFTPCLRVKQAIIEIVILMAYGLWLMAYGFLHQASSLWLMPYTLCLMPYTLCLMPYALSLMP